MSVQIPKSNIMPISNIYPLRKTLMSDTEFHKQVRGRTALGTMLTKTLGLAHLHIDEIKQYLTPEQILNWDDSTCSLLREPDELIYGPVLRNGVVKSVCKCWKVECPHFASCRPGVDSLQVRRQRDSWNSIGVITEWQPSDKPIDEEKFVEPLVDQIRLETLDGHVDRKTSFKSPEPEVDQIEQDVASFAPADGELHEDDELREKIITAPPNARMFISAGPGTGKTHTLVERIQNMVATQDFNPAQDMLVLCFTRTAVREVQQRLRAAVKQKDLSTSLLELNIRTFDSFATELLHEFECDTRGLNYDERISMAVQVMHERGEELEPWKHLFVDEIQDLVGNRARFVLALLRNAVGFTLLGDPLQGIYDYQVRDLSEEMDSKSFRQAIEKEFTASLERYSLFVNKRQHGKWAQFVAQAREELLSAEVSKRNAFLERVKLLPSSGPFHRPEIQKEEGRTIGILCRTNGEVLKMSGYLQLQKLFPIIRREGASRLLPAWLADVFYLEETVTREVWLRWNELQNLLSPVEAGSAYEQLKRLEGLGGAFLNLDVLRNKLLREQGLPEVWVGERLQNVMLTTIHQSKGREFDKVYVAGRRHSADDLQEESRVLYVAVTRVKEQLFTIEPPRNKIQKSASGRWMEIGSAKNNPKHKKLISLEISTNDFDVECFAARDIDENDVQTILRTSLHPGDSLDLNWNQDRNCYELVHGEQIIGRTNDAFAEDVQRVIKAIYGSKAEMPQAFRDLLVHKVYTVVRSPLQIGDRVADSFAERGVWLGVSVLGMGRPEWKGYEPNREEQTK